MEVQKRKTMSDKSYLPTWGTLQIKVTPFIDFTDEPVIQYDIPIGQNTSVGDCK